MVPAVVVVVVVGTILILEEHKFIFGGGSGSHSKRDGADDGTKTGLKGAALLVGSDRARRGTTGRGSGTKSSTTKGVKATKKSITGTKTLSNSQDYRFAPLTISNNVMKRVVV